MAQVAIFARMGKASNDGVINIEVIDRTEKKGLDPTLVLRVETRQDYLTLFLDRESLEVLCKSVTAANAKVETKPAQVAP